DDFPARYTAYARREHRWVRGDWQLLPWLGRRVPTKGQREERRAGGVSPLLEEETGGLRPPLACSAENPLPSFGGWKVVDNPRRSLVPPAFLLLLLLGWTVLPGSPLAWSLVALAVVFFPALPLLLGTLARVAGRHARAELANARATMPSTLGQSFLS